MLDREIIKALLEIKAVELRVDKENWFTWASGIKSPIYCDNRLTMSYPKIRKQIAEGFSWNSNCWYSTCCMDK